MEYHHIETLQCKLKITEKELHTSLQKKLMQFYDTGLFQVLHKVFEKFKTQHLKIPKIQLTLPPIPAHHFSNHYLPLIEKELTNFLEAYCKTLEETTKNNEKNTTKKDIVTTIVTYLEKGYYPRTDTVNFKDLWEQAIKENPKQLLEQLRNGFNKEAIQRLVYQLTEVKLWEVFQLLNIAIKPLQAYSEILQKIKQNTSTKESSQGHRKDAQFWQRILTQVLNKNSKRVGIENFIKQHFTHFCKKNNLSITFLLRCVEASKNDVLIEQLGVVLKKQEQDETTSSKNSIHKTEILGVIHKYLNKETLFKNSRLQHQIFKELTFKEQEVFLFSISLKHIEAMLLKKHFVINSYYSQIKEAYTAVLFQKKLKEVVFRYAYGYFLEIENRVFQEHHFIKYLKKRIEQSLHIKYTQKQRYLRVCNNRHAQVDLENKSGLLPLKKEETDFLETTETSNIIFQYLKYGTFPENHTNLTKHDVDVLFQKQFAIDHSIQWKQQYENFRKKGATIYTTVLENYLTEDPTKIKYLIQLDAWVPLRKIEIQTIKKGMQQKQKRTPVFAKNLVKSLPETAVKTVISYLEQKHSTTILHFVKTSVAVASKQSLTDKITDFKKEIYAFVVSYLLLKTGYDFNKKQFVIYHLKKLAQHFNIKYATIIELFLNTLHANTVFNKTKELYHIINTLSIQENKEGKEVAIEIHETDNILRRKQISKNAWSSLYIYYIKHQKFPSWTSIVSFKALIEVMPLVVRTQKSIASFLASEPQINAFFKSKEAQQKKRGLTEAITNILHKKEPDKISAKRNIPTKKDSENRIEATIWSQMFLYYITYGTFPDYIQLKNFKALIAHIPLAEKSKEKITAFLSSQPLIVSFLKSEIAQRKNIQLTDCVSYLLEEKEVTPVFFKPENKKEATLLKNTMEATAWLEVFIYYITYGNFPKDIQLKKFKTFVTHMPLAVKSKEKIIAFLTSQPLLVSFLKTEIAQQKNIQLTDCVAYLLEEKGVVPIFFKSPHKKETALQQESYKTTQATHNISVLLYYMKHEVFPWWTSDTSLSRFLKDLVIDEKALKTIRHFFQEHKNASPIWRTINRMSKKNDFRVLLLQCMLPEARYQVSLKPLAAVFSPVSQEGKQQFIKHFGSLPKGSLFWKYLWNTRRLFFSNTSHNLSTFWRGMQREFGMQATPFNEASLAILKTQKVIKVWQPIMRSTTPKVIEQTGIVVLDATFIEAQLFNSSKKKTIADIKRLKRGLQTSPSNFINLVEKLLYNKNISKTSLQKVYTHWVTIWFPKLSAQLIAVFKELAILEKSSNIYTLNDYKFTSVFIFKAASKFRFKNKTDYLQTLFLALARYKKMTFMNLVTPLDATISKNKKELPALYSGMLLLKLEGHIAVKKEDTETMKELLVLEKKSEKPKTTTPLEAVLIPNAGIVLLWKFLPMLFERLQLWNGKSKEFHDDKAKNKAILVLQYLATKSTVFEDEHELLLMKLICGFPSEFSVIEGDLLEEEQEICEGLLVAAISQWKKLGTLSVAGFRSTFISREGLVAVTEEKTHITIEPTGTDILLDYLPWSISRLRLPWLEKSMVVSWREKQVF